MIWFRHTSVDHSLVQYGLIGRNGVGKTTLLRHMAAYDIEGFPRHHRVMHVRQEIKPSEKTVIQVRCETWGGGVTVDGGVLRVRVGLFPT